MRPVPCVRRRFALSLQLTVTAENHASSEGTPSSKLTAISTALCTYDVNCKGVLQAENKPNVTDVSSQQQPQYCFWSVGSMFTHNASSNVVLPVMLDLTRKRYGRASHWGQRPSVTCVQTCTTTIHTQQAQGGRIVLGHPIKIPRRANGHLKGDVDKSQPLRWHR